MLRKLAVLLLLTLAAIGVFFLYVDRLVKERLNSRESAQGSAIYSQAERFTLGPGINLTRLLTQVRAREYRETNVTPQLPGELRLTETSLDLITREFHAANGASVAPSRIAVDLQTSTASAPQDPAAQAFYLEPQVLTLLGSGETRKSRYKDLQSIPRSLRDAVIAVEDQRFYSHLGVDFIGIGRAMVANIKALRIVEGGSTVTQQLAKNMLFTPRRTLGRKLLEAFAALSLERRLSKDMILELYLNEVYLGQEGPIAIHGVAEAARKFFDKNIEAIGLGEAALLAGIIRAPSAYSPIHHLDRALGRRDQALQLMYEQQLISLQQLEQAKAAVVTITNKTSYSRSAAHFTSAVLRALSENLDVDAAAAGGLAVHSGIDIKMQECGERAVSEGLAGLEKTFPKLKNGSPLEGGLVAIEPFSGLIKSWIGGRDYGTNQFDHVRQASRQMGSTIKPFVYLSALDEQRNNYKVATPITVLPDRPLTIRLPDGTDWEPENYDHQIRGDVTLRYALEQSLNLPAVYVVQRIGVPSLVQTLKDFGVVESVPAVPSLALGSVDSTLLAVTTAYAALANGGVYVAPRLFISAVDGSGNLLTTSRIDERRISREEPVFVLTNMMQGVLERGTGHVIRTGGYGGVAAGKTGTSSDARDAWFAGFTPNLAVGVWVGYDTHRYLGLTGAQAAAPIWTSFMKCAEPYHDDLDFIQPPGVVLAELDAQTMERATPQCPPANIIQEFFVEGTEPGQYCTLHGSGEAAPPAQEEPQQQPKHRKRSFWDILFGG